MTVKFLGLGLAGYLVAMLPLRAIASPVIATSKVDLLLNPIWLDLAKNIALVSANALLISLTFWISLAFGMMLERVGNNND